MIILIILVIALVIDIYLMLRNNEVLVFSRKLIHMAGNYHRRHLELDLQGKESAFNWFSNKYPYWRLLFSFKPLKLEYWFTQEELDKINSQIMCKICDKLKNSVDEESWVESIIDSNGYTSMSLTKYDEDDICLEYDSPEESFSIEVNYCPICGRRLKDS